MHFEDIGVGEGAVYLDFVFYEPAPYFCLAKTGVYHLHGGFSILGMPDFINLGREPAAYFLDDAGGIGGLGGNFRHAPMFFHSSIVYNHYRMEESIVDVTSLKTGIHKPEKSNLGRGHCPGTRYEPAAPSACPMSLAPSPRRTKLTTAKCTEPYLGCWFQFLPTPHPLCLLLSNSMRHVEQTRLPGN